MILADGSGKVLGVTIAVTELDVEKVASTNSIRSAAQPHFRDEGSFFDELLY